ncbi:MAG: SHOCT domain-containing protein [Gammaproteobacteria bacterium]|nr:SHOCT domain-containing protein [Gammaproteobacteria bacterium]MCP5201990.1 SHOCT domain-containing protein [Gammaproteobacteria bacterium]
MSKTYFRSLGARFTATILACAVPLSGFALDLLPDFFKKDEVTATIWDLNEQYVRLVKIEDDAAPNDHPVALDRIEVEQALASLQLWVEGGVFRDEEATTVYPRKQAAMIAHYVTDALGRAAPNEDVTFNVRGYADVMLSFAREREWTTGRVFYKDGKLNLIIGEYGKRLDKAKKTVEGSFGITDDFRDVNFQSGSRHQRGKMPGRVVTTAGVELGEGRPDWIVIDVAKAALAYREAAVPMAVRKEEQKAKAEAAKLTLERRQMREEMARLRKELQDLQDGGAAAGGTASLEERLSKLQELHQKGLISDEDFARRKDEILGEL